MNDDRAKIASREEGMPPTLACSKRKPHDPHRWQSVDGDGARIRWCPGLRTEITGSGASPNLPPYYVDQPVSPRNEMGAWERPDHYGGEDNPFEAIKIIEHYDLNFNLGSVIKYVLRAPFKGTPLTDLKKAYTYIGFEIRRRERAGETE